MFIEFKLWIYENKQLKYLTNKIFIKENEKINIINKFFFYLIKRMI